MAGFRQLLTTMRRAEKKLERQLKEVRAAIESLEFGSAAPEMPRLGKTRVARGSRSADVARTPRTPRPRRRR